MSFFVRLARSTSQTLSERTVRTTMDSPAHHPVVDEVDVRMVDVNANAGAGPSGTVPEIIPVQAPDVPIVNEEVLPAPPPLNLGHAPAAVTPSEVLTRTLLQVLETQRQQADYLRALMERRDDAPSSDFVSKKADKVLWAALDKVKRFDGLGNRTFDMFLSDFMNAADMADLAAGKYLKVMHSMVIGEALTYARTAVIPPVEKGGLESLSMDEYVEKMREGRFGDALNPIQRMSRILCMTQQEKPLEMFLKDVERELNLLPQDTPGWVKVSLTLWGMKPTIASQVQSNPRDPNGMFHDYIQFRNHALSNVQVLHKDNKSTVWKRQGPTPPVPPAKILKPNTVDWSKIQCKHCGQFGHGSAASRYCSKHDPNWIKKGLNQLQKPLKKA